MSIQVVATQMSVIFIFMLIGYYMAKKELLLPMTCKQISGLIVNVCSPSLMVTSVLNAESSVTGDDLLRVTIVALVLFAIQILLGNLMGRILRAPRPEWTAYNMTTIFGNIGFIGIPVALAVLGSESVIYAAVFNLIFNFLIYTYGIAITAKNSADRTAKFDPRKLLNIGNLASVTSLILFFTGLKLPAVAGSALQYMANTVTFLSVLVIGASITKVPLNEMFSDVRVYLFVLIRMLVFPIATAFCMKQIMDDPLMIGLTVLMVAMPAANMPLMLAEQYDQDTTIYSKIIVVSTLLSVVTITITAVFV